MEQVVIRKLYSIAAFVSLAGLLALGGFAGYLYGTGKIDASKVDAMAAVLRGETAASKPAASQPASQPSASQPALRQVRSADELKKQRREEMLQRAVMEGAARDVSAQRDLLDKAVADLMTREEDFDRRKATWKKEQEKLSEELKDDGFERELKYVSSLSAKQAKDHLIKTWNKRKADAVRLLTSLEPSKGKRILDQLKTPEELEILHELLEQLRETNVDKLAPGSGKTTGDARKKS